MDNLLYRLNEDQNFHLSFKVIQITDDNLLDEFKQILSNKNILSEVITSSDNLYEVLKALKDKNVEYLLVNEKVSILLPLVTVITKDDISVVRPMIDVYYMLKDNKIIQRVKTAANKKLTKYYSFKNKEELFSAILKEVKIDE